MATAPILVDPSRLDVIRAIAARERAAHAAAAERLRDAMATEAQLEREARRANVRAVQMMNSDAALRADRLENDRQRARNETIDVSARVEEAKDRLAAASRLRAACEDYAAQATSHVR